MDIFENICRTCSSDCLDALNIFEDSVTLLDRSILISDLLSSCQPTSGSLPALSQDDDYPKQICRVCLKKLMMIYEFNNNWITANIEFTVALKFEQRRKRSHLTQHSVPDEQISHFKCDVLGVDTDSEHIEADSTDFKDQTIMFKHEPSTGMESLDNAEDSDNKINYQCVICEEYFYTFVAYKIHHVVCHRNGRFV